MLALTTALPFQVKWDAAGTAIKENGTLTFAPIQEEISVLHFNKLNPVKIKVNIPLPPKSTVE